MADCWTVSLGRANHTGYTCRECRGTIFTNEPICVRDGRKIRLFYHKRCYSGDADPRTQARSSFSNKFLAICAKAPGYKGRGKWWTSEFRYRVHIVAPPTFRNLCESPVPSEELRRPTSILRQEISSDQSSYCDQSTCSQTPTLVDFDSDFEQSLAKRWKYTFERRCSKGSLNAMGQMNTF